MNLKELIENKYYKFTKYLTGAILVLSSIIALVAAWYVQTPAGTVEVVTSSLANSAGTPLIVLGFLSLILSVVLFATRTKELVSVPALALSLIMIIILLVLSGLVIDQTWLHAVPAPAAP